MDFNVFKEFIRPELLVLSPVLYLAGAALKASERIPDRRIPLILGAVGTVLSLLYLAAASSLSDWREILMMVFAGITQGILTAGASVYVNQVYKQAGRDD